jgi:hypothetical protein
MPRDHFANATAWQAIPMTAPTPNAGTASADRTFSATINVTQVGSAGGVVFVLLPFMMLCASPRFWLATLWDVDATGWRALYATAGMFGSTALAMAGMVGGIVLWAMFEQWRCARKGTTPFHDSTQVTIDRNGLAIAGMGTSTWIDVLSYEGVPDSDDYLIVHTRQYGRLLFHCAADVLAPLLDHYMGEMRAGELRQARDPGDAAPFRFTAVVFHWPTFFAWIAAGYAAAALVGIVLVASGPDTGMVKTLVCLVVLMPLCAWLVWSIPFWQLSLFAASRTRAFVLAGDILRTTDGAWYIDVRTARVRARTEKGVGYALSFISVRPPRGRRLDMLMDVPESSMLMDKLIEMGALEALREQR